MKFIESNLYHIYNRGNNRQKIFFTPANYLFFLRKTKKYIRTYCDILSYCLMPNHFHFLIHANNKTVMNVGKGRNVLSEGVKNLLSSYAKAINVQEKRTGSLFTQNTHGKNVTGKIKHAFSCFHYIHQNPLRAGLVDRIEDWHYSSFRDYCGFRNGTMCNKDLARELFDFNDENFYSLSYGVIQNNFLKNIF